MAALAAAHPGCAVTLYYWSTEDGTFRLESGAGIHADLFRMAAELRERLARHWSGCSAPRSA
jgi:hypothetical protein